MANEVSEVFDIDLIRFSEDIESIKKSNDSSMVSMTEVAVGVQEQVVNIGEINNNMSNAEELLTESNQISDSISKMSSEMVRNVETGSGKINHVDNQMKMVNKSIVTALVTVESLESSINEIGKFLQGITRISNQTNLLALNAITKKVFSYFVNISGKIQSISSIAEQNSAANEEFLTLIGSQDTDMSNMLTGVRNINNKWNELKGMLINS